MQQKIWVLFSSARKLIQRLDESALYFHSETRTINLIPLL